MSDNDINEKVLIYKKGDKVSLFFAHPSPLGFQNGSDCETRRKNRQVINWIRKNCPKVLNEFRTLTHWNEYANEWLWWGETHFCAYEMPFKDYLRLKLSWTYTEKRVHIRMRKQKPEKPKNFFNKHYLKPTQKCVNRFAQPKFRQKLLKIE